jgi:hypothetical protein
MRKPLLVGGAVAAFFASAVRAANPTIIVGNAVLFPNRSGQTIPIMVSGGTAVSGLNFNVEVAGGGTVNGGTTGPAITSVDLTTGTIFSANNSGQQNIPSNSPQVYEGGISTTSGTVTATGLLATITVDTTGFQGSTFSLKLTGFGSAGASGNTDFTVDGNFNPIPANVTNGNIVAVYPGDANLDGSVNFTDFTTLTQHYNLQTGGTWSTGDFNRDGSVNFTDFTLMTQNYNKSLNINPPPPAAALPSDAALVPEPTSLFAATLSLLGLRRRRKLS